jgi:hypothetical protein
MTKKKKMFNYNRAFLRPCFIALCCYISLRSRRYSRARENGKLEIPPAQKLHILSSPAAGWRSILIGQNVDFEFLIDRSIKELE